MNKKLVVFLSIIFIGSIFYGQVAKTEAAENRVFMRATGDSKVYQIINGKKLHLTLTAFNSLGAPWKQIQIVSKNKIDGYPRIKLMKVGQYGQVFYLTETGLKRHIPNPEVFSSYSNRWEDVLTVDTNTLTYPDNILIRKENDAKVYLLKDQEVTENGLTKITKVKKWIKTAEEFNTAGYNWNQIAIINETELNSYQDASLAPEICNINYSSVPLMENFAKKVKEVCNTNYPKIEQLLENSLSKPYKIIIREQNNPGESLGGIVYLNSLWFTAHPDDLGAIIHEMAHVIQNYPAGQPSWLTEGIANYIHYWIGYQGWDPAGYPPHCNSNERYTSGYACAAVFLQYLERVYDKDIVLKLNKSLRIGNYNDSLFPSYTGKDLETLWQECRQSDCIGGLL